MKIFVVLLTIILLAIIPNRSGLDEFITTNEYCFESFDKLNINYLTKNTSIHSNSYTETIKIDITKKAFNTTSFFRQSVLELVIAGQLPVFSLNKENKLSTTEILEKFTKTDTIISFDPVTFEEEVLIRNGSPLSNIQCYKIEQKWKVRKNELQIEVMGLIPIYKENDENTEIAWVKNEQTSINSIINNPDISWIKFNEEVIQIPDDMKANKMFKKVIWENPKNNRIPIFEPDFNIFLANQKYKKNYINDVLSKELRDTMKKYDPETMEVESEILVREKIKYEDINHLRISQVFYINHHTNSIGCKLIGVIPLIEVEVKSIDAKYFTQLYQIVFEEIE